MFHPIEPNLFLSWITAWKKERPNSIDLQHFVKSNLLSISRCRDFLAVS